jgi:hypothetical protein
MHCCYYCYDYKYFNDLEEHDQMTVTSLAAYDHLEPLTYVLVSVHRCNSHH